MKIKVLALILAILTVFPLLVGCSADDSEKAPTPDTTVADTTPEEDPPTPPPAIGTEILVDIKWNFGMVASADYYAKPNTVIDNENYYSYTDVIEIPFAGTTITFVDDNTNSNNDKNFSTHTSYVFSSWKKHNGKWLIDTDSLNNYTGYDDAFSDVRKTSGGVATYTYTTASNNECIRLCFRSGQTANFTPAEFPKVSIVYTAGQPTAAKKLQYHTWAKSTSSSFHSKALEGLTVNAIGDSYFAGNGLDRDYVWLSLLEAKYGMDMNNYGMNASMLSNYTGTGNQMCKRYANMANNNADIVIIEGGKNDYNKGTPIGKVDSLDDKTFMGALNVTINGIREKYPNAMIVCITVWNFPGDSNGLTYESYAKAMQEVAAAQGVYCINASDPEISGVNMAQGAFKKQYCMKSSDVSHLNADGMMIVFEKFEKLIAGFYEDFLSKNK